MAYTLLQIGAKVEGCVADDACGYNATAAIAEGVKYPNIRTMTVGTTTTSYTPLAELGVPPTLLWTPANPAALGQGYWTATSAVCWYFGKGLYDKLQIPIGLISSNWGGTIIESWVDNATLSQCPKPPGDQSGLELSNRGLGVGVAVSPMNYTYKGQGFIAKGGDVATVNATVKEAEAMCTGIPACQGLTFRSNSSDCDGKVCKILLKNQATYTNASGWQSYTNTRVPRPNTGPGINSGQGVLYNAMINPLTPMAVAGFVWFQGESDSAPPQNLTYSCLQQGLIKLWREQFYASSTAFFGFVELEPWFRQGPWGDGPVPELRQAQLESCSLPNVGYATATDCGDPLSADGSIHPRMKKRIADRLVASALTLRYKLPTVYLPPTYAGATAMSSGRSVMVTVYFNDLPTKLVAAHDYCKTHMLAQNGSGVWFSTGLSASLCSWFTIIGSDGGRYNATATPTPDGKQLVLTATVNQSGTTAIATSFGWNSWPINTIMSAEGLPLQPWPDEMVNATISSHTVAL